MTTPTPTLYEWMGGEAAIERLFTRFYERVPADPLLGPVFAHMDPHHAAHVAAFVGEVFGGPRVAYLEWGTRLAVHNSQPGATVVEAAPMPAWGWGEVKGPYIP